MNTELFDAYAGYEKVTESLVPLSAEVTGFSRAQIRKIMAQGGYRLEGRTIHLGKKIYEIPQGLEEKYGFKDVRTAETEDGQMFFDMEDEA